MFFLHGSASNVILAFSGSAEIEIFVCMGQVSLFMDWKQQRGYS